MNERPWTRPLAACFTWVLATTPASAQTDDPILDAYTGTVTATKIAAARDGLEGLTGELGFLPEPECPGCRNLPGGGFSGGIIITNPSIDFPFVPFVPFRPVVIAAGDADLGPPGAVLRLDDVLLRMGDTFTTDRAIEISPRGASIDTNGFDLTALGSVHAEGALSKLGAGTLALLGQATWRAPLHVLGGSVIGTTSSLDTNLFVDRETVVEVLQERDGAYTHEASGRGTVRKTGQGTLIVEGTLRTSRVEVEAGGLAIEGTIRSDWLDMGDGTTVSLAPDGALRIDVELSMGSGATVDASATDADVIANGVSGAGEVLLGSGDLVISNRLGTTSSGSLVNATTFTGSIRGDGGLAQRGGRGLVLTGAHSYLGGTVVTGGALALSGAGALPTLSPLILLGGAFDISAADGERSVGYLSGDGGVVRLGANTLVVGGAGLDGTYSGAITGDGGIRKVGPESLGLAGENTFTGTTTVEAGTLVARARSISPDVVNDAQLVLTSPEDGFDVYSGRITGSGELAKEGEGALWLRGEVRQEGGIAVRQGALVGNVESLTGTISNDATLAFYQVDDGRLDATVSGSGLVMKYGPGRWTVDSALTHTGGTAIAGPVALGAGATLGPVGGSVLLAGATVHLGADLTLHHPVGLGTDGASIDTAGHRGVLAGPLSGPGHLAKTGDGTLVLTDPASHAGGTRVERGTLLAAGGVGGDVAVDADGVLALTAPVTGTVTVRGTLVLGEPQGTTPTTITVGALRLEPGSRLRVDAGPDGAGDRIVVAPASGGASGQAEIAGGAVEVRAAAGSWRRSTAFPLISATDGIAGRFEGVTSDLAFLTPRLDYAPDAVTLVLDRNDVRFDGVASGGDQRSIARLLDTVESHASGDLGMVLDTLVGLDADSARHALDGIAGGARAAQTVAQSQLAQTITRGVGARLGVVGAFPAAATTPSLFPVSSRADNAPSPSREPLGLAASLTGQPSTAAPRPGVWARGLTGEGEVDGDGTSTGFDHETRGLMVGFDRLLAEQVLVGAYWARTSLGVDQNGLAATAESDGHTIGLYARGRSGPWHLDAIVGIGRDRHDTSRRITVGTIERTATAAFDSTTYLGALELGRTFALGPVAVQPHLGIELSRVSRDGYTERGAGALGLVVAAHDEDQARVVAGLRLGGNLAATPGGLGATVVEARLAWAQDLLDREAQSARLGGDPAGNAFAIRGADVDRGALRLGGGVVTEIAPGMSAFVDGDAEIAGDRRGWSASAGLRLHW
ncbi:MAG: autotransporter domain-containing protein [Ectothiorhodospiraceae bacterium]|nr:autotransporter domain-containing protein [Ectothiorhodospiraceae bacterium]